MNVTKTFLPPFETYSKTLKRAWDKGWITNNGELVLELESKLKAYFQTRHLSYTGNGTIVLQMALKALKITKEVITTPYSYVATGNAIKWEGCTPVFVDIDADSFCINAELIEAAITENTQAILATHVYGLPCNVEKIQKIATKHGLPVIYDGAHAFGSIYKGKALLNFGTISTCSFHATKLFHTVEGGCIICQDDKLSHQLELYRQFGHIGEDYFSIGINGKNSEFHAAMGLVMLPLMAQLIEERKELYKSYQFHLQGLGLEIIEPGQFSSLEWNYAYFPVVFQTEEHLLVVRKALEEKGIYPRRYFYPSLSSLPFLAEKDNCPISESISKRVLALPFYNGLSETELLFVVKIIHSTLHRTA